MMSLSLGRARPDWLHADMSLVTAYSLIYLSGLTSFTRLHLTTSNSESLVPFSASRSFFVCKATD